jgi:hypothetical protein
MKGNKGKSCEKRKYDVGDENIVFRGKVDNLEGL